MHSANTVQGREGAALEKRIRPIFHGMQFVKIPLHDSRYIGQS